MQAITELRCEGLSRPIGIDRSMPELSWRYAGSGAFQQSYRVRVFTAAGQPVWDSGTVQTAWGRCAVGAPLQEHTAYMWQVEVHSDSGAEGGVCAGSQFETGMFSQASWKAYWITGGTLLRKAFKLKSKPVRARLFFSGLGYCEAYVNGARITDYQLFPSYTLYNKRVEYTAVDVTEHLQHGENVIGLMLGGHWPVDKDLRATGVYSDVYYQGQLRGICHLELTCRDGASCVIASDETWQASKSPILSSSVFDGEYYDARWEKPGWSAPGYAAADWAPAQLYTGESGRLCLATLPPTRMAREWAPLERRELDGKIIVDFGTNHTGWLKLTVRGERGAKVQMRHGELLYADGTLNTENLQNARATDTYVLKGGADESYAPRFTYHGFRYAEITTTGAVEILGIVTQEVHTDAPPTGEFRCSNPLLNRIHAAMRQTLASNMQSIPTDCCQRDERQGWLGDAGIVSDFNALNFDVQNFYRKWLGDIRDSQSPDGNLPLAGAPGWERDSFMWRTGYSRTLRTLYTRYGDRRSVEENYPALQRYEAYLRGTLTDGLIPQDFFNDWLALETHDNLALSNLFLVDFYNDMELFAAVAGDAAGKKEYSVKRESLRELVHEHFYAKSPNDPCGTGYYGACDTLAVSPSAAALLYGVVPDGVRDKVIRTMMHEIVEARGSVQLPTGLILTGITVDSLSELDRDDIVYRFFERTEYPSFGFMLGRGATTIWEHWRYLTGNAMNSHNQPGLCSAGGWLHKALCGLRSMQVEDNGVCTLQLRPYCPADMEWASYHFDSTWGVMAFCWKRRRDGRVLYEVTLPPNTRAHVETEKGPVELLHGVHHLEL